jgi:RNA-binding motif protein, X-linked 2
VLAVDNFNGTKLAGRSIRVDHVKDYKPPKEHENDDDLIRTLKELGCAPDIKLPPPSTSPPSSSSRRRKEDKHSFHTKEESKRFKR